MKTRDPIVSDFIPFDWRGLLIALIWYGLEIIGFGGFIAVLIGWWIATPGNVL